MRHRDRLRAAWRVLTADEVTIDEAPETAAEVPVQHVVVHHTEVRAEVEEHERDGLVTTTPVWFYLQTSDVQSIVEMPLPKGCRWWVSGRRLPMPGAHVVRCEREA